MRPTVSVFGIAVDQALYDFVNEEALPGTGVKPEDFWKGFKEFFGYFLKNFSIEYFMKDFFSGFSLF